MVVRVATAERTRRQAIGDGIVTLIAFPLLIICTILLISCMNTDWVRDGRARVRVLGLGITLLLLSLCVCVYTIQRLGICSWPSAEQRAMPEHRMRRRTISGCLPGLSDKYSELNLIMGGNYPPSYNSILRSSDIPPPYCHLTYSNEVPNKTENTRSLLHPQHAAFRPPGTG